MNKLKDLIDKARSYVFSSSLISSRYQSYLQNNHKSLNWATHCHPLSLLFFLLFFFLRNFIFAVSSGTGNCKSFLEEDALLSAKNWSLAKLSWSKRYLIIWWLLSKSSFGKIHLIESNLFIGYIVTRVQCMLVYMLATNYHLMLV